MLDAYNHFMWGLFGGSYVKSTTWDIDFFVSASTWEND